MHAPIHPPQTELQLQVAVYNPLPLQNSIHLLGPVHYGTLYCNYIQPYYLLGGVFSLGLELVGLVQRGCETVHLLTEFLVVVTCLLQLSLQLPHSPLTTLSHLLQ